MGNVLVKQLVAYPYCRLMGTKLAPQKSVWQFSQRGHLRSCIYSDSPQPDRAKAALHMRSHGAKLDG